MYFMVSGSEKMNIAYYNLTDVLYIRLDDRTQKVINKQIAEDIVLDLGEDEKLAGIEIINASKQIKYVHKSNKTIIALLKGSNCLSYLLDSFVTFNISSIISSFRLFCFDSSAL